MQSKKCGIYMILCTTNNKKYIGQSVNIYRRWSDHKGDLKKNCHANQHLQNSWNLYGEEVFLFTILEECDRLELDRREDFWINYYNACGRDEGYNIIKPLDIERIDYPMNKRLPAGLSKLSKEERRKLSKKVTSINLQTGEIKEYESANEVSEKMNIKLTRVQAVLSTWKNSKAKFKSWTTNNLILLYSDLYNPETNYIEKYNQLIQEAHIITGEKTKKDKPIIIRKPRQDKKIRVVNTEKGLYKDFSSIKSMTRELKLDIAAVRRCLRGIHSQHKGYTFKLI